MGDVKGAIHTTCQHSSCAWEAKEIKEEEASRMSGDWGHQGCAQVRRLENYVDITFWDSTDTTRTSHTPWTSQTWQPPNPSTCPSECRSRLHGRHRLHGHHRQSPSGRAAAGRFIGPIGSAAAGRFISPIGSATAGRFIGPIPLVNTLSRMAGCGFKPCS